MNAHSAGLIDRAARVEDALELVLRAISRRPAERVPLSNAAGRVLAEPIEATEDLWPFARAAMDGVAVRASDVLAASDGSPVALRVAGAIYSGQVWPSPLEPGTAVRIATGAPTPGGADAVVPQELLEWRRDEVLVSCPIARGRHIFPAGEDARAGDVVLQAGTVLNGGDVSLLAALGHSLVSVVKKATVAILACGDELIAPSAVLQPGQVRESNCYALAAEAAALGAEPRLLGIARDTDPDLNLKIQEGLNADALIVCGGLSVGERDLVKGALQRAGVVLQFAGVSMKPGAPAVFGLAGGRPVFGLPGTPGAARIAFEVLVRPALCAMMGHRSILRPRVVARLAEPITVTPGRRRYLWGRVMLDSSGVRVVPLGRQGTATLRSASEANALIVIEPDDAALAPGTQVTVQLLAPAGLPTAQADRVGVVGIVGARGAGKTMLIERLIPALRQRGIAVAVVKHHAHGDMCDGETTDTGRAAIAGAVETVLAGPGGMVHRHPVDGREPPLQQVLASIGGVDLVLVEGYSGAPIPKILVRRGGVETDRPSPAGPIVAVVGDQATGDAPGDVGERFGWDALEGLAEFVARRFVWSHRLTAWEEHS